MSLHLPETSPQSSLTSLCLSGDDYCLPVYVRCNTLNDCPGHEDELQCEDPDCPGLYRCLGSAVCLNPTHVCDGWSQCPLHDDEKFCHLICPHTCLCHGHSYECKRHVSLSQYPQLRFLLAMGSGIQPGDLGSNTLLIYLNLARCQLTQFGNVVFPNLHTLDVSFNHVKHVSLEDINQFPRIVSLSLAGNPLVSLFGAPNQSAFPASHSLLTLDLSFVELQTMDPSVLRLFPNLQTLNLSHCNLQHVHGQGFHLLTALRALDVRKCPLTSFPKFMLKGLSSLRRVFADNYKVCCPVNLPGGFVVGQCMAPSDEISSCDALLRLDIYRISLIVFATLAIVGNILSFALSAFILKGKKQAGYAVFVTHLCVSDFLMGVYLVMIGAADRIYGNSYLWEDKDWKNSVACNMAGFLSLLSSEMSASIICLITLDRFIVVRFPFSHFRFQRRSAQLGCLLLWTMGLVLAAVPLLPASWHFYSQTAICIPLPVTRQDFPGQDYAFAVMIIFNFVLFLVIAVGQLVVYLAIRSQSMVKQDDNDRKSKDLDVAQRLFTVVLSDFLCWFPIGLIGLLASRDIPISGEVNVGMAVFVLPLNSALNPFLYSLNTIQTHRARRREQKLLRTLLAERSLLK